LRDHMSSSFSSKQQAGNGLDTCMPSCDEKHKLHSARRLDRVGQEASATCKPEGTRPGPPFCLQLGEHSEFAATCMAGRHAAPRVQMQCNTCLTKLLDQYNVSDRPVARSGTCSCLFLARLCSCMPRCQGRECERDMCYSASYYRPCAVAIGAACSAATCIALRHVLMRSLI